MKHISMTILAISLLSATASPQMKFIENAEMGTLTIREGKRDILTYCFGDQLPEGVAPKHTRSCFIHPLYSLDGLVLTNNFPADHLHHHGLFWTWPVAKTRGLDTQTWHSVSPSLQQYFGRWMQRKIENGKAILEVENVWKLSGKEVVARETVSLQIHPADKYGRVFDLELIIQAVGGPLELQGAPEQNKGYGGLSLRGASMFTGAVLTTNKGSFKKDLNNQRFHWADISSKKLGITIFVSPDHPDFPTTWIFRNSYAGFLNASWPGLDPFILQPEKPVALKYRLYIHDGDAAAARIKEVYQQYLHSLQGN